MDNIEPTAAFIISGLLILTYLIMLRREVISRRKAARRATFQKSPAQTSASINKTLNRL